VSHKERAGNYESHKKPRIGDPYLQRDPFEDVRKVVESQLDAKGGAPLTEKEWAWLKDNPHWLKGVREDRERWLPHLLHQLEIHRTHFPPGARSRGGDEVIEVAPDARSQALAQLAVFAPMHIPWLSKGIREFRADVLGDRLISMEDVPAWIEAKAAAEGPPAPRYIRIPCYLDYSDPEDQVYVEPSHNDRKKIAHMLAHELEELARSILTDDRAELPAAHTRYWPENLEFFKLDLRGLQVDRIPIRGDGELAWLKALASYVKPYFSWREAQAVSLILTGGSPVSSRATATITSYFINAFYSAFSKISLKVDPRLSPKEVARLYSETRKRYGRTGRDKPMSAKHLALAVFTEQMRDSGLSWELLRQKWNSQCPKEMRYPARDDHARLFALECRDAWTRLTGCKWKDRPLTSKDEETT
jgi:hypothetical protein